MIYCMSLLHTIGTNACGRGTDIITKSFPLHVIVAYYYSNSRAMNQAFVRTAREGKKRNLSYHMFKRSILFSN